MGTYFRDDRGCFYYRFTKNGKQYRKFGFRTRLEARLAERDKRRELNDNANLTPRSLAVVANEYITRAEQLGRSHWRIKSLRIRFNSTLLPFFGTGIPVSRITPQKIEEFAQHQLARGNKKATAHNYLVDLSVILNYAIGKRYLLRNPVKLADLSMLRNRKMVKKPLDPQIVERGAQVLTGIDRAYYNCVRYTGMRMDEANRLTWDDVDFEGLRIHIPGTKAHLAETWQPVPRALIEELTALPRQSELVFPSRQPGRRGDKCYSRKRLTAQLRKAGIALKVKDLRDWYITEIASLAGDPAVVMQLARHSNLTMTTTYLRVVQDRMREVVTKLGETPPEAKPNDSAQESK